MKKIFKPWIIAIVINVLVLSIVIAVANVTIAAWDKSIEDDSNVVNTEIIVSYPDNDNPDKYDIDVYFNTNKIGSVKPGEYLDKSLEIAENDLYGGAGLEFRNSSDPIKFVSVYRPDMNRNGTTRYIVDGSEENPRCIPVKMCLAPKMFVNDSYEELVSYTQMNQEKVAEEFKDEGFVYIYTQALGDLKKGQEDQVGKVAGISIDGIDDYSHKEHFLSTSKVVVKYHSMPDEDTSLKTYTENVIH